jgi:cytochrome c oxidase subunit 1
MFMNPTLRKIVLAEIIIPISLLVFGIYHGLLQTLYRAGIIRATSFLGIGYYQGLTAHGVINAIVLTTFFAVAFGHTLIVQCLHKQVQKMFAVVGFWLMLLGTLMAAAMIFTGQADVLYTFYPPLKAHPIFYFGLALFVVGSWCALFSWIQPYFEWRRENPNKKVPLAVVGIFVTFIIWQIATIPVAFEVLFMLIPWSMGWVPGINVTLAKTLFWFFGHPLVYFWLLPAYIMYYTMLPKLAGSKIYSDFAGRFSLLIFLVLSSPIGIHHQFADPGISANWKAFHGVITIFIAIPSLMTAFSVAASLEYGARKAGGKGLFRWWTKLPYFEESRWLFSYLFCGLFIFIFGGLTGLVNASLAMNLVIHNTAWLPAHFHLTVGGPVFLAILGMSLYIVSGLMNKDMVHKKLALLVPYLWTLGVCTFSTGLFIGGVYGEPRRTNSGLTYLNPESPMFRPDWVSSTHIGVLGASIMTLSALIYFYVFFRTIFAKTSTQPQEFSFPESDVYHDEDIHAVKNLRPWVYAAVVAVIVAYGAPLYDLSRKGWGEEGSKRFLPTSPLAEPDAK